jgi:hypothetical protein
MLVQWLGAASIYGFAGLVLLAIGISLAIRDSVGLEYLRPARWPYIAAGVFVAALVLIMLERADHAESSAADSENTSALAQASPG